MCVHVECSGESVLRPVVRQNESGSETQAQRRRGIWVVNYY